MQATGRNRFQLKLGVVLSTAALEYERLKHPHSNDVALRARLEVKYERVKQKRRREPSHSSRAAGAVWLDYVTGRRAVPMNLLSTLWVRFFGLTTTTLTAKTETEKKIETLAYETIGKVFGLKAEFRSGDILMLGVLWPEFLHRATKLQEEFDDLVYEATHDRTSLRPRFLTLLLQDTWEELENSPY